MPKLIVIHGADAGKQYSLAEDIVTLGRHSGNLVHLHDHKVSRRHLEIRQDGQNDYQLIDLGSGNGTLLNGQQVQTALLRPGDRITIGDTILVFTDDGNGSLPQVSQQGDRTIISSRPVKDLPSAIVRTVAEDEGSRILSHADRVGTDWLRTRLASLTAMHEATEAVSHIMDTDQLLGKVIDLVMRTTEADHGCVVLVDRDTGKFTPKAAKTRSGLSQDTLVISRTVIEHVLENRQGILIADALADERFRGGDSIAKHQMREVICVPMKGRHETVGVMFLDTIGIHPVVTTSWSETSPLRFTEDHLRLTVALAHQAGMAVEETRYYQALLQAEKLAAVGQTIAALSHHIKNIMQGVRFGSDMVRIGLKDNDNSLLLKGWRLVEKNQAKIDDLILDMLSYSKDREPLYEPTNLNSLVREVIEVVRGRAGEAGVSIDWQPDSKLPTVSCDPDGIQHALLNVISNAVDAVSEIDDGKVEIVSQLSSQESRVEIVIRDNGPGIPKEMLGEIFKPFISTKGSKGTGLGLPVSRKILREHGGDIVAENAEPNGCRFTFSLPISDKESADSSDSV